MLLLFAAIFDLLWFTVSVGMIIVVLFHEQPIILKLCTSTVFEVS